MIIPMLCVTIFVILVVWFLLPRVARLMIHTPTAISIFVCLSMVQLVAVFIFFFFQAEDGIRDRTVTGVQTCALPISSYMISSMIRSSMERKARAPVPFVTAWAASAFKAPLVTFSRTFSIEKSLVYCLRSEERRVGKECRSGGWSEEVDKSRSECIVHR